MNIVRTLTVVVLSTVVGAISATAITFLILKQPTSQTGEPNLTPSPESSLIKTPSPSLPPSPSLTPSPSLVPSPSPAPTPDLVALRLLLHEVFSNHLNELEGRYQFDGGRSSGLSISQNKLIFTASYSFVRTSNNYAGNGVVEQTNYAKCIYKVIKTKGRYFLRFQDSEITWSYPNKWWKQNTYGNSSEPAVLWETTYGDMYSGIIETRNDWVSGVQLCLEQIR